MTTVKHLLPIAAISAALTACSMGTGILPAGPDTYTVTERRAPVLGGSTTAQQAAMTEANAFCAQQGRQFLPVDMVTPPSANPLRGDWVFSDFPMSDAWRPGAFGVAPSA